MGKKGNISSDDIRNMIRKQAGIDRCVLCGKCASVCPSFRELQTEAFSPRGRMALANAFLEERLSPGGRYFETLLCCLGCRACEKACPARVRPGWANLLFKNLPEFQKLHEDFVNILHKDRDKHYPENLFTHLGLKISKESFMELFPGSTNEFKPENISSEVFYFPGCVNNYVWTRAARSTANLLERLGYKVIVPGEFYCCGAPHIFLGDLETGRDLAEKNLRIFEEHQDKTIICDCAGCASTIRIWSDLFPEQSALRNLAEKIAGNIQILSEFIKGHSPTPAFTNPGKEEIISYMDSCTMRYGLGIENPSRCISESVRGLNFKNWPEELICPGWGMLLLAGYSDIPERILHRINRYLEDEKITTIITEDSACYAFLKKNQSLVKTLSLSEFICRLIH